MALSRRISPAKLAATSLGVAAFAIALGGVARAETSVADPARTLASELRIARGDLVLLKTDDLPEAHRTGLRARIAGALGLLPWLLQKAGDAEGAASLAEHGARLDDRARLTTALDALIDRHPLDLVSVGTDGASAKAMLEARAIHETYCAGCHDGAGGGDPEDELPTRDLFAMARAEPADVFVARLYNGIKGDETIGFVNPLTEEQFLSLWRYYSTD